MKESRKKKTFCGHRVIIANKNICSRNALKETFRHTDGTLCSFYTKKMVVGLMAFTTVPFSWYFFFLLIGAGLVFAGVRW
jgi:hypothetical protein